MVRIIVGTLIDVGRGYFSVLDIVEMLNAKNRARAGKTIGSQGLVLKDVYYDNLVWQKEDE